MNINNIFESQDEYELQGHISFRGLPIDIENKKGSFRCGKDPNGKEWRNYMYNIYGRIRGTSTKADKEEIDVYVGDFKNAEYVYQIRQMKAPYYKKFDEYKYMLGFKNKGQAIEAYLKQYNDPGFFGGVEEIPFSEFKSKIKDYYDKTDEVIKCSNCGTKFHTKKQENVQRKYVCPNCEFDNNKTLNESVNLYYSIEQLLYKLEG